MLTWPPAVLSLDRQYRYFLGRRWNPEGKTIAFIGLNPSTADETLDDPTIRRCIGFAKSWGGGTLLMVNLFAFRSTSPSALRTASDPIGPDNEHWLERVVDNADIVVAAWGNHGELMQRGEQVRRRFAGRLHALDVTKSGMPKHPLYIAASKSLVPFNTR